jgi:hypothetical protein
VNGNQHYKDKNYQILNDYCQKRHELIEKEGIEVLEVHYSKCFNKSFLKTIYLFLGC